MTKRNLNDESEKCLHNGQIELADKNATNTDNVPAAKKAKSFSVKEFRKLLGTNMRTQALEDFLFLLQKNAERDNLISEYFQCGGSCLELLQVWENDASCPLPIVFAIVQMLIVAIIKDYEELQQITLEACRYLLNTHMTLINKALQFSSTTEERWATLQLLAAIVSFSSSLVKDILLHVKFPTNILTKHMHSTKKNVRHAFINFLMAFFINGHYPTILQLLSKQYLLGSIMPGLRYDMIDTVSLVLTMLKMHIIDNTCVPKPVRVKFFSNVVIKGLVYLYNWLGPTCIDERRQRQIDGEVNLQDKETIAEHVHAIMLVVCTSFKHGIIFRDELLGTGQLHRNPMMFNLIEASFGHDVFNSALQQELIVKMSAECPDLVKAVWTKLLPSLAPRATLRWWKAIRFLRQLVAEMHPRSSMYIATQLKSLQYAQVVQLHVAPTLILQQINAQQFEFESSTVKLEVTMAIADILQAVRRFLEQSQELFADNYVRTLRRFLEDHLQRNMPSAESLVKDWMRLPSEECEEALPAYNRLVYVTHVVDILALYHELCPGLLTNLTFTNAEELLTAEFEECSVDDDWKVLNFRVVFVHLLLLLDPTQFHVSGKLLPCAIETLSKGLRLQGADIKEVRESDASHCISRILQATGFFADCTYEIAIWVEALKHKQMPEFVLHLLSLTHCDSKRIALELAELRDSCVDLAEVECDATERNDDTILQSLCREDYKTFSAWKPIKQVLFSKIIAVAIQQNASKKVRKHLGNIALNVFHLQTDYRCFQKLVQKYRENLPDNVGEYITCWPELPLINLPSICDTTDVHLKQILVTSTVLFELLNIDQSADTCSSLIENAKQYASSTLDLIYSHPKLHRSFQPGSIDVSSISSNCMQFLTEITEHLQSSDEHSNLAPYLKQYQWRLYNSVIKNVADAPNAVTMPKSGIEKLIRIINVFGMSEEECLHILKMLSVRCRSDFVNDETRLNHAYYILVAILNYFATLDQAGVGDGDELLDNVKRLLHLLAEFNMCNIDTSELAAAMRRYLVRFDLHIMGEHIRKYLGSSFGRDEYCQENALLTIAIFERMEAVHNTFEDHLESICRKKGLILPLLEIVALDEPLEVRTYALLTPMLEKIVQKPAKAGQHVENHYRGLCRLIENHATPEMVKMHLDKTQKSTTDKVFLAAIWKSMFLKYFADAKGDNHEKQANNALMTFVHYVVNMLKVIQKKSEDNEVESDVDSLKLEEVVWLFTQVINALPQNISMKSTCDNETFQLFCKLCLKHGIGGTKTYFMDVLTLLAKRIAFSAEESAAFMEMLLGHSGFMDVALGEPSRAKLAVFSFVHVLCTLQASVMERKHVPLLLSAYSATMHPADRRVLSILMLYEEQWQQTMFYDFKPFLWGITASNFYTLRPHGRRGLSRQPRTGDLLDILQLSVIESTLVNFPQRISLTSEPINTGLSDEVAVQVYDIGFLLSVLAQVLSSENVLPTYKLTRSGAISLVVIALASRTLSTRTAACHVLAKFYYHLEANATSKDIPLWLRFVEVVAKAVGGVHGHQLNSFAAIFMARTALAIANPTDAMFAPLSNFLGVTLAPKLTCVPELYTFLHSADVHHLIHRHFILRILYDGLRTEDDFTVAAAVRAFKLIMQLFNSALCDTASREIILQILARAVALPKAARILCNSYGLSAWLCNLLRLNSYSEKVIAICQLLAQHKGLKSTMIEVNMATEQFNHSLDVDSSSVII